MSNRVKRGTAGIGVSEYSTAKSNGKIINLWDFIRFLLQTDQQPFKNTFFVIALNY